MKLPSRQFLRGIIVILAASHLASAQRQAQVPPFQSWGGGPFDNVNLGNLSVRFTIPVLHKAGRGTPFAYDISYNGAQLWSPVTSNGTTQWQPANAFGWSNTSGGGMGGYVSYYTTTTSGTCPIDPPTQLGTYTEVSYSSFVYHDQYGFSHYLNTLADYMTTTGCTSPPDGPTPTTAETSLTDDGTGYTFSVGPATANSISGYLVTRSGTTIYPLFISGPPAGSSWSSTDSNGNVISESAGSWTDTLGTQVLALAGSGTPSSPTTLTYVAPSGGNATYTINYTQYTVATNFGVSGISEYGPISNALVNNIELPDGTEYQFTYEPTTGSCTPLADTYSANCVTGRIASITLPTGGQITYTYNSGSNLIESDGSTASLIRALTATTTAPAQSWSYSRQLVSGTPGPGSTWTTTVTDPSSNQTVINFSEDSATTYNLYETQRKVYQGSISATSCSYTVTSNCLLLTTTNCYNASYSTCATAAVSSPITETDYYAQPAGGTTRLSRVLYNGYGLVTDDREYGYGVTTGANPGTTSLVRETSTVYASLTVVICTPATRSRNRTSRFSSPTISSR
jgi:hypothetical protein